MLFWTVSSSARAEHVTTFAIITTLTRPLRAPGIDVLTFPVAFEVTPWARLELNVHLWLYGVSIPAHETHYKLYWAFEEPWIETRNDQLTFDLSGLSADIGAQFQFTDWLPPGWYSYRVSPLV